MIKSEELMIGNYIIQVIDHQTEKIIDVSWQEMKWLIASNNIYKPIPITEEIIKKFGFQWKNNGLRKDNFVIRQYGGGFAVFLSIETFNFKIDIESVHQLQNLYFALTQKHLTFNQND